MFHPPTGSTRRNATLQKLSALGVGVFVGTSCVGGGAHEDGDEEQASFGGADAKNDDQYSSCELREALAFLNRVCATRPSPGYERRDRRPRTSSPTATAPTGRSARRTTTSSTT